MKRAAMYLRVSTVGQAVDGYGLAAQEAECRAYAAAQGLEIVATFADEGVSGTTKPEDRPGLLAALMALRDDDADVLLVARLDRLARTLTIQETVLAEVWGLKGAAREVHAVSEDGVVLRDDPDDPVRTFVRQILGGVAQLDRAMTVKRLRDGRRVKGAAGGHATGPAPYGWSADAGALHPVATEQAALATMLTLRDTGATTREIATVLATEGHPSKRGGAWTQPVVARILSRHRDDDPARYAAGDAPWIAPTRAAVPA